ncbi:hypothetical protein BC826DRAFT_166226 [Russula brevipes]|nr:hypothetical protein BC826DRAFT_166226 [Russula brevipes]
MLLAVGIKVLPSVVCPSFVRPRRILSAPKFAHTGCTAAHNTHSSHAERTRQHPRCVHRHAPRPRARRRPLPLPPPGCCPLSRSRRMCSAGTGWPPFPDAANRNGPSAAADAGGDQRRASVLGHLGWRAGWQRKVYERVGGGRLVKRSWLCRTSKCRLAMCC